MENNSEEDSQDILDRPKPVFLLILDGWGIAAKNEANAISLAKLPNFLKLFREYPAGALLPLPTDLNARYFSLGVGRDVLDEAEMESELESVAQDVTALVSAAGLKQLKIFESERLAALTYFFNGRREEKILGEDWLALSSASDDSPFDAELLRKRFFLESRRAVKEGKHDLIIASLPLLDLVASTGDLMATIKMAEKIDKAIKPLATEILDNGGVLLIVSTQGNAEKMKDLATDLADKNTTKNPVPFVIIGEEFKGKTIGLKDAPDGDLSLAEVSGSLAAVSATILDLLEIDISKRSSNESLAN